MANKETIIPPAKKALKDGSKELKKGHPAGGRVLADEPVAKREGVKRKKRRESIRRLQTE